MKKAITKIILALVITATIFFFGSCINSIIKTKALVNLAQGNN